MPAGVSIKGDEFRRVIVKPEPGVSTFIWKDTYFYREPEFDGIDLRATYFDNARELLRSNKEYIADEVVAWIDSQVALNTGIWAGFTYDKQKCERDTKIILDGIEYDLKWNGNEKTHLNASRYFLGTTSYVNGQQAQTAAALDKARDIVTDFIFTNTAYSSLQSKTTQTLDSTNAEAGANTRVDTLMNMISGVIVNGLNTLPSLDSSSYGYPSN